jgi:transcription factor E2F3
MGDDPDNRERLFVADSDITSLPCFAADTLFAVKAPLGTTLEVGWQLADNKTRAGLL